MARDYYIQEARADCEALQRWEDEGGRSRQQYDKSVNAVAENYSRRKEQRYGIRIRADPYDIPSAMLFL